MKVLQTLGVHQGGQAGIFQYKRTSEGVIIDPTVGFNESAEKFTVSSEQWDDMLTRLENIGNKVVNLTDLKDEVSDELGLNNSEAAAIVAILEHEGTFDHYGGVAGRGESVSITLRRDD
ncbi:hypothetical protein WP3W18E01_17430 [Raoultella ornithinolytica]|nr:MULTISPECIES: hypothetical protein [Klebsiella]MDU7190192.1 hypothetical protein [Enterobacter sp.]BBQ77775.1 hypothetical protein WP3W18E01_17430 [Raoultella ornithinolytica]DAL35239.1 MAG TPA_asm: hypothetical protein [Caudoviricetes sp.]HBR8099457.1 hypothetical protein [Klebsiella variicola subsp. variicola]EKU2994811.1 hypothetical protein [Klebsiella pneumoniae]